MEQILRINDVSVDSILERMSLADESLREKLRATILTHLAASPLLDQRGLNRVQNDRVLALGDRLTGELFPIMRSWIEAIQIEISPDSASEALYIDIVFPTYQMRSRVANWPFSFGEALTSLPSDSQTNLDIY